MLVSCFLNFIRIGPMNPLEFQGIKVEYYTLKFETIENAAMKSH